MSPLKVLLIVYAFPPAGGVGVLRAASLARYFPAEVKIHRTITLDLPFGIKKRPKRLITGSKPPDSKADSTSKTGNPNLLKRVL